MRITVDPTYPGLAVQAFTADYPSPLAETETSEPVRALLAPDAAAPIQREEAVRLAVRDLLRARGYKPTGRGKPSPEYLARAAESGRLGPINAAVDACNAVSLHSGLPISVVDLGRAAAPFAIRPADPGERYVFNASGQEIALDGLLCLWDARGPCANPVRDSQRTKTHEGTTRTLSVVWAPEAHAERLDGAARWYRALVEASGARTEVAEVSAAA